MKAIIVDDEQNALDLIYVLLTSHEEIDIVGTYTDPFDVLKNLSHPEIDVAFLDMEMGDFTGAQIAEHLQQMYPHIAIVFITAHSHYALEAFDVHAVDYLVKPVSPARLKKSIDRLLMLYHLPLARKIPEPETEEVTYAIQSLGTFRIMNSLGEEMKWRTRKVKELFIYLWLHGQARSKSQIIEDLWSEVPDSKGLSILYTTVYQLRKSLQKIGFEKPIQLINEQYRLDAYLPSDYEKLVQLLDQSHLTEQELVHLFLLKEQSFCQYEGYQWLIPIRQNLTERYVRVLERKLTKLDESSDLYRQCVENLVDIDPYNESYIEQLLHYYGQEGNVYQLHEKTQQLKKIWQEELDIHLPEHLQVLHLYYA